MSLPRKDDGAPRRSGGRNSDIATGVVFLTDVPTPYIIEMLRALASKVDLTCLFCSDRSTRGMPWNFSRELGFRYSIVGGAVLRRRDPDNTDYYLSPRIIWRLARCHPEVIISGGFSFPSLYSLLYARLFAAKLIIYSDGTTRSERNFSKFQIAARKFMLARVAACVAKSGAAVRRFQELGPVGPIFLAPHTANLAPLLEIAATRDYSARPQLRLLTVGRLIKRKGIDRLIRSLARLGPIRRPVTLTIVGSGPEESHLRALVKTLGLQDVQFVGFVDQPELPAYYAHSDAFVFPSLDDPFGIVLLEAAASGLALIASSEAGATNDLVLNDKTGFVFDPQDEVALARHIALLADNPDVVHQLGRTACEVARQRTPERVIQGYLSAIEAALGRHQ